MRTSTLSERATGQQAKAYLALSSPSITLLNSSIDALESRIPFTNTVGVPGTPSFLAGALFTLTSFGCFPGSRPPVDFPRFHPTAAGWLFELWTLHLFRFLYSLAG